MMPRLAFCIACVGNGHFTQALTVAWYLRDRFQFSMIHLVALADADTDGLRRKVTSSILYKDLGDVTVQSIDTLATHDLRHKTKTQITVACEVLGAIRPMAARFQHHRVDLILDFFTNVPEVSGIPVVSISRQLISVNDQINNPLIRMFKLPSRLHCAICLSPSDVAYTQSTDFIDGDVPPLIDTTPITRRVVRGTCLVYIRDPDHCGSIAQLVAHNPGVAFTVFTDHVTSLSMHNRNVHVHKPGPDFRKHLATTQVLITSSGVESICEALFHRIPVVVLKPPRGDEEQTFNYQYYIAHDMAIPFSPSLVLADVRRPIFKHTDWFIRYCLTAERRVHDLVDTAMMTRPSTSQQVIDAWAKSLGDVCTTHHRLNQLVNRTMMHHAWRFES